MTIQPCPHGSSRTAIHPSCKQRLHSKPPFRAARSKAVNPLLSRVSVFAPDSSRSQLLRARQSSPCDQPRLCQHQLQATAWWFLSLLSCVFQRSHQRFHGRDAKQCAHACQPNLRQFSSERAEQTWSMQKKQKEELTFSEQETAVLKWLPNAEALKLKLL